MMCGKTLWPAGSGFASRVAHLINRKRLAEQEISNGVHGLVITYGRTEGRRANVPSAVPQFPSVNRKTFPALSSCQRRFNQSA
jgi:hypothetical protein